MINYIGGADSVDRRMSSILICIKESYFEFAINMGVKLQRTFSK